MARNTGYRREIKAYPLEKEKVNLPDDNILSDKTRFDIVEAYKAARTNIIYSLIEGDTKTVALTSSSPAEGKTTTCINLAITFAETGARVLLIDGDLRKPHIHRYLKLQSKPGLTNVLGGFSLIRDAVQKTAYENLFALVCGHIPPNPTELLASKNMEGLLEELKKEYDYIFIDSPPINTVTDAAVISKLVSGIILVIRHALTTFDEVNSAIEKLKLVNTRILGFILNDSKENQKYYKKGYGKKRKYSYYSD